MEGDFAMKNFKKWMVIFACLSILVQTGATVEGDVQPFGYLHEEIDVL